MSQFKDTDIGSIPNEWEISNIGSVADVTKLAGYEYTEYFKYSDNDEIIALRALNVREGILDLDNVKYISRDVSEALPRSKLFKHDLLFTYIGANIGQFAIVPENDRFHLAPNICRFRCNQDYYYYFLYSYMRSSAFRDSLEGYSHGSSQPTLPMGIIRTIPVPVPPLPEQKAIASVLSSLDDKIDLLHRQNKTLEAMAETLFRQWFIEEAKEDWEEKPLSSIATFTNGLACQKYPPQPNEPKLPVLKIKDLTSGISDSSDWATANVDSKYIVNHGDVIFAWSASLMVKIWFGETCVLNQHLFNVTSDEYPKWFFYQWCKYHLEEFISISQSHATTMGHIKRKDLDEAIVKVPSQSELQEMTSSFEPLMDKLITNLKQIKTLENLRDTLLPKLMSGEVRVQYQTEEVA